MAYFEFPQIYITFGKSNIHVFEKESERGETITEEALEKELEKWFK
jgi:hypothetical protein